MGYWLMVIGLVVIWLMGYLVNGYWVIWLMVIGYWLIGYLVNGYWVNGLLVICIGKFDRGPQYRGDCHSLNPEIEINRSSGQKIFDLRWSNRFKRTSQNQI